MLFTIELSERLREKGITVNAADPGIVSTDIITMHQWFDPLTDIFFRPFIRTPKKGGLPLPSASCWMRQWPESADSFMQAIVGKSCRTTTFIMCRKNSCGK